MTDAAMIFIKVLSHMDDDELRFMVVYARMVALLTSGGPLQEVASNLPMTWSGLRSDPGGEAQEDLLGFSVRLRITCWREIFDNQSNSVPLLPRRLPQALDKALSNWFWSLHAFLCREAEFALLNDKIAWVSWDYARVKAA